MNVTTARMTIVSGCPRATLFVLQVGLVVSLLAACTSFDVTHQFVPRADGARYETHDLEGVDHWRPVFAPANYLTIERDDVSLACAALNWASSPMFMGPAAFPVIPVFPLFFFFGEMKLHPLLVLVQVSPSRGTIDFIPGQVEVLDSEGNRLSLRDVQTIPAIQERGYASRYDFPPKEFIAPEAVMTLAGPQAYLYEFDRGAESVVKSFTLNVKGVSRGGVPILLPSVRLEKIAGLAFFSAP